MPVFKLKTLTPIWTGGVDIGRADRIHETGIRGSLRWWYEALIRGLGGYACDPSEDGKTGPKRCELDQKKFKETFDKTKDMQSAFDEQICPACQLFGCGGWSGKIKIACSFDGKMETVGIRTRQKRRDRFAERPAGGMSTINNVPPDEFKPVDLSISLMKKYLEEEFHLFYLILFLICEYGMLAAKSAQGCGVIQVMNPDDHKEVKAKLKEISLTDFIYWVQKRCKGRRGAEFHSSLEEMIFEEYEFIFNEHIDNLIAKQQFFDLDRNNSSRSKEWLDFWRRYQYLPIAPHIRDAFRNKIIDRDERHDIMGKMRSGSRVKISNGYKTSENSVRFRLIYDCSGTKIKINELSNILLDKNHLDKFLIAEGIINNIISSCSMKYMYSGTEVLKRYLKGGHHAL